MEFLNDVMQTDLIELWKLQETLKVTVTANGKEAAEAYLRELLGRAKTFVTRYSPDSYTLSLGFQAETGLSFTWESKKRSGPRLLTA
jgi:hypothetical protein